MRSNGRLDPSVDVPGWIKSGVPANANTSSAVLRSIRSAPTCPEEVTTPRPPNPPELGRRGMNNWVSAYVAGVVPLPWSGSVMYAHSLTLTGYGVLTSIESETGPGPTGARPRSDLPPVAASSAVVLLHELPNGSK